jgi:short-subunit dehydrogenase
VPKATKMLPVLSPEEAAEAIYSGVSRGSRTVIKPFLLRPLFLLNAFMPRLVEAQMRRMSKPRA